MVPIGASVSRVSFDFERERRRLCVGLGKAVGEKLRRTEQDSYAKLLFSLQADQ